MIRGRVKTSFFSITKTKMVIVAVLIVLGVGGAIWRTKSQSNLRDVVLNADQNALLSDMDKQVESAYKAFLDARSQRDNGLAIMGVSNGIKKEDLYRFKEEKVAGVTHLIEMSEQEIKRRQEEAKAKAEAQQPNQ